MRILLWLVILCFSWPLEAALLRDNLQRAHAGDFLVISFCRHYTLLHIYDKQPGRLLIEEMIVPVSRMPRHLSWREWARQGSPCATSWSYFSLAMPSGQVQETFSRIQHRWLDPAQTQNVLMTLLNLSLQPVPEWQQRRIGPKPQGAIDQRPYWQPRMIVNGQVIPQVPFAAWSATWPQDGGELSGKNIELYIPIENEKYPAYFPYWIQIEGMGGQGTLHVVESGRDLVSSPLPPELLEGA